MKFLAALALIPILSGCAFSGLVSKETKVANDSASCIGYGFTPGTEAFANCMLRMDEIRREDDRERRIALGLALRDLGNSLKGPDTLTCNRSGTMYGVGSTVYSNSTTRCY